jgi:uncharacterized protein (TIGR03086 family)
MVMDLDLGPAADQMAAIVLNIREEQLAEPTPCDRTSVADMLTHVHGQSIAFRDAARKILGPTTSTPAAADGAQLPGDWRHSIQVQLAELVEAWRAPEAWQGETMAGGLTMPAEVTGLVVNNELVLHGWDLARATGQPYEVHPANLEASWQFVVNTPDDPKDREGLFGPRLPIADDAPLLDRTLAYAGRDPQWSGWAT